MREGVSVPLSVPTVPRHDDLHPQPSVWAESPGSTFPQGSGCIAVSSGVQDCGGPNRGEGEAVAVVVEISGFASFPIAVSEHQLNLKYI